MDQTLIRVASCVFVALVAGCGSDSHNTDGKAGGGVSKTPDASSAVDNAPGDEKVTAAGAGAEAIGGAGAGSAGKPAAGGAGADAPAGKGVEMAGKPAEPAAKDAGAASACDLSGTFALRQRFTVKLMGVAGTEDIEDTLDYLAIVHSEADAEGSVKLSFTGCGQSALDICGQGLPPLLQLSEAYATYVPVESWDKASAPVAVAQVAMPSVAQGAEFVTAPIPQLAGIKLMDPLGAWPSGRKDVEGGTDYDGSAVNGAQWVDFDGDGQLGFTLHSVPPGGVAAGVKDGPAASYAATSTSCPRKDAKAQRSPYAYLPAPDGVSLGRVKREAMGQRLISELHGKVESCDRIAGDITGPKGGNVVLNVLVGGCVLASGSDEKTCPASVLDLFGATSGAGQGLQLSAGKFVMTRVKDDITCAPVIGMKFD